jgi:hypothetical protein
MNDEAQGESNPIDVDVDVDALLEYQSIENVFKESVESILNGEDTPTSLAHILFKCQCYYTNFEIHNKYFSIIRDFRSMYAPRKSRLRANKDQINWLGLTYKQEMLSTDSTEKSRKIKVISNFMSSIRTRLQSLWEDKLSRWQQMMKAEPICCSSEDAQVVLSLHCKDKQDPLLEFAHKAFSEESFDSVLFLQHQPIFELWIDSSCYIDIDNHSSFIPGTVVNCLCLCSYRNQFYNTYR